MAGGVSGILVVDKPADWTSQDVVSKLRGALHVRRVGHGGTLDPMATGVLPVFVGRATRAASLCENADKEYLAGFLPGVVTDTDDVTGTVLERRPCALTREEVAAALPRLTGELQQVPPMYSAVKIGGKKLYELARKGVEVERQPRTVTISRLELLEDGADGVFPLRVCCSKGTYIRTLCHDLGELLGCGGTMASLRRIRAGSFSIGQAVPLAELLTGPERYLLPVDSLFAAYPAVTADAQQEARIRNGNPYPAPETADGSYRVYGKEGFLMVGRCEDGVMTTVKSFFEVEET
jgi:tRNA pseudouridine55 synthase